MEIQKPVFASSFRSQNLCVGKHWNVQVTGISEDLESRCTKIQDILVELSVVDIIFTNPYTIELKELQQLIN